MRKQRLASPTYSSLLIYLLLVLGLQCTKDSSTQSRSQSRPSFRMKRDLSAKTLEEIEFKALIELRDKSLPKVPGASNMTEMERNEALKTIALELARAKYAWSKSGYVIEKAKAAGLSLKWRCFLHDAVRWGSFGTEIHCSLRPGGPPRYLLRMMFADYGYSGLKKAEVKKDIIVFPDMAAASQMPYAGPWFTEDYRVVRFQEDATLVVHGCDPTKYR